MIKKKIAFVAAVCALIMGLAGCGPEENPAPSVSPSPTATVKPLESGNISAPVLDAAKKAIETADQYTTYKIDEKTAAEQVKAIVEEIGETTAEEDTLLKKEISELSAVLEGTKIGVKGYQDVADARNALATRIGAETKEYKE